MRAIAGGNQSIKERINASLAQERFRQSALLVRHKPD